MQTLYCQRKVQWFLSMDCPAAHFKNYFPYLLIIHFRFNKFEFSALESLSLTKSIFIYRFIIYVFIYLFCGPASFSSVSDMSNQCLSCMQEQQQVRWRQIREEVLSETEGDVDTDERCCDHEADEVGNSTCPL